MSEYISTLLDISLDSFDHAGFNPNLPYENAHKFQINIEKINIGHFKLLVTHQYILKQDFKKVVGIATTVVYDIKEPGKEKMTMITVLNMIGFVLEYTRALFGRECKEAFGVFINMLQPTIDDIGKNLEENIIRRN